MCLVATCCCCCWWYDWASKVVAAGAVALENTPWWWWWWRWWRFRATDAVFSFCFPAPRRKVFFVRFVLKRYSISTTCVCGVLRWTHTPIGDRRSLFHDTTVHYTRAPRTFQHLKEFKYRAGTNAPPRIINNNNGEASRDILSVVSRRRRGTESRAVVDDDLKKEISLQIVRNGWLSRLPNSPANLKIWVFRRRLRAHDHFEFTLHTKKPELSSSSLSLFFLIPPSSYYPSSLHTQRILHKHLNQEFERSTSNT